MPGAPSGVRKKFNSIYILMTVPGWYNGIGRAGKQFSAFKSIKNVIYIIIKDNILSKLRSLIYLVLPLKSPAKTNIIY